MPTIIDVGYFSVLKKDSIYKCWERDKRRESLLDDINVGYILPFLRFFLERILLKSYCLVSFIAIPYNGVVHKLVT